MKTLNYPVFNEELYYKLIDIVSSHKYLEYKVVEYDGKRYSIFTYKSNGNFTTPEERECRGSMAEITKDNKFIKWVCRPFEKFFELNQLENKEGWRTHINDFYGESDSYLMFLKLDGSIISSFMNNDKLSFKSNTALNNNFVDQSKKYLDDHPDFKEKITNVTNSGYTVIFELTLRNKPIIIQYNTDKLTVIGVRKIETGEYWNYDKMLNYFGKDYIVEKIENHTIEDIKNRTDIEGVVLLYENGLRIKVKTFDYMRKHNKMDRWILTVKKKLFYSCVSKLSIDRMTNKLKSLKYSDDDINNYKKVASIIKDWIDEKYDNALNYYNNNKDKDIPQYKSDCKLDDPSRFISISMRYNGKVRMDQIIHNLYARNRRNINKFINNTIANLNINVSE